MSTAEASIIRSREYQLLSDVTLDGVILDVGGGRKSDYHQLIKGSHTFFVINLDPNSDPDVFVDIEKPFPLETEKYDHAICLNVMEHIFEFDHVFREQLRCVKKGGNLIFATPMVYHIHGSPDDYLRYTASSYRRLAEKYNCEIVQLTPIGTGLCSLIFQTIEGGIPRGLLRRFGKSLAVKSDFVLNKISKKYRVMTERVPLGYFVILKKSAVIEPNF